ncbi:FAD binding domain-containing protein [Helicovermis profundi]|uniref:FAD binding domain-containing protein n=1 Tax=Helicovermis profundi TaxID=3065157 RepID=A0AAU9E0U0_9FIRM|nr:FAD binding domain-containing protein [Clostridia bacterium S502]
MINFDFDYYRPSKIEDAYNLMNKLANDGLKAVYYSGGTELITSFRKGTVKADAVIDIKNIEGMTIINNKSIEVTIGSCASLNKVIETFKDTILSEVLVTIADHTARNAITIGGNILGKLTYKEALLPLLALKASVLVYTKEGIKEITLEQVFDKRIKLDKADILFQIKFNKNNMSTYHTKRYTESTEVDYPILHIVSTKIETGYFIGLSGYSNFPIYQNFELKETIEEDIYNYFEEFAKEDIRSSKDYRRHLLKTVLKDMEMGLEGFND